MSSKLSEATVDALLDRLAEDDAFRASFMANPKAATESLGTKDPATASLPSAAIARLAPKDAIRRSRGVLRQRLLAAGAPFEPVSFQLPE